MPRPHKGAHLWLRPEQPRDGRIAPAVWIIKDGGSQVSTGCHAGDRAEAERKLSRHIASKYAPERRERGLAEIPLADVLNIYLSDVAPGHAAPAKTVERCVRLGLFFAGKTLADINGKLCRDYAASRHGVGPTGVGKNASAPGGRKGAGGGARRDLQDLAAAIAHHWREGLHRNEIRIALPPKGEARQRWLTRDEAARLLKVCWRAREIQSGTATAKHPLRHLCRFLLLGLYTGSRPGAILRASWLPGPGLALVDANNAVFHRHADGAAATDKRQPTVKLAPRLLAHLKRWERLDRAAGRVFVVAFAGAQVASVKTALQRACKLAGLEAGVTAYTLRHTAASWLVKQGLATRKIADFLGTSEAMILAHYGHLAPDYQEEAALAIGRK